MASVAEQPSAYTEANIILKAVHPDPFLEGTIRARIFIQQVDNKIVDAAETSNERKVRYATFLLRE
jgi:tRNA threonylcarbamoyladenosine modification (KEOPS) complex  Pcc1 subunit